MNYARANNTDKIMTYYITRSDAVNVLKMVADSVFYERLSRELDGGYTVTIDNTTHSFIIEDMGGKYESFDVTSYHAIKLENGSVSISTCYTGDEQTSDGWTVRLSYNVITDDSNTL